MYNTSVIPIAEKIINVLAPHDCLGCGQEGALLCLACAHDVLPLPDRCYGCLKLSKDGAVCTACRRRSPLRHVWVRAQYDGLPKDLVTALKFGRARVASKIIADLMAESLPYIPAETIVAAVPTATKRARHRGYDQGVLLARVVSSSKGLQYVPLLARMGQSRQVGADRKARKQQLQDAFRSVNVAKIKGADILLVDDIVTTGATLEAAATVLKKAGARSVNAIVFAQKQ